MKHVIKDDSNDLYDDVALIEAAVFVSAWTKLAPPS